jgi:hypothetical protein
MKGLLDLDEDLEEVVGVPAVLLHDGKHDVLVRSDRKFGHVWFSRRVNEQKTLAGLGGGKRFGC